MTTLSLEALRERLTALIAAACLSAPPVCPAAIRAGNGDVLVEVDSPPAATAVAVDNEIHLLVTNAGASAGIRIRSLLPGWKLVSPSGGTGQVSVGSPLDYKIVEEPDREAAKSGRIRMFAADFTVEPDAPSGGGTLAGDLTDSQRATVFPRLSGISSFRGHSVSMSVRHEQVDGVVNKMGTSISVAVNASATTWKTTPVYWYGVNPDGCCYHRRFNYVFDLFVDGIRCASRKYDVGWPEENPRMEYNINALTSSSSSVGDVEEDPLTNDLWRAKVMFAPFADKTGLVVDCPANSQYAAEIQAEESFHKMQWEAKVGIELGGSGDCFTVRGLRWFARHNSSVVTLSDDDCIYGESRNDAYMKAWRLIRNAESMEVEKSRVIYAARRGYREKAAKEHAGYGAAFMYHCTYQGLYGENPTNVVHDAYR